MWMWIGVAVFAFLVVVFFYDVVQRKHAILRNYPVIGHLRYILESLGPELRQYIVTSDDEERPFTRDQRRWVYASAKRQNNYFGFGTDNDLELAPHHLIIKHAAFPPAELRAAPGPSASAAGPSAPTANGAEGPAHARTTDATKAPAGTGPRVADPHGSASPSAQPREPAHADGLHRLPCAKVLGRARGRARAFRPESVVNISGMSFGSLSAAAVEAMNRGARLAGSLHNTGEGGISPYHRKGADLIWQIGTAYFGCRDERGRFSMERFLEAVAANPVRAIEIKLSQGAKPGLGGVLPAAKVTKEIAAIRLIPLGRDCISPAYHAEFSDADGLLDFVERLAEATGLPVGIKSAVGELGFWQELARLMVRGDRGVDFITIDGGEGGTGAAPLVFTDHVALPFKLGMSRVYRVFAEAGLHEDIVFIGSGKLGFPQTALVAFALGCDMVNVGREAMLAVGCIQAQRCHTGRCPTGVATQSRWLMRGLDPTSKAARVANYISTLRKELAMLSRACGVVHPALVTCDHMEILDERFGAMNLFDVFGYEREWGLPSEADRAEIRRIMAGAPPAATPVVVHG
ncbi:MAG TPA: FMN-binding glutamate synthase family protein [Longimicrobiales bacterium]